MRREIILLALVLILTGVYFLLIGLEMNVPTLDRMWPVFPFVGGMVLLSNYVRSNRESPGAIFWGSYLTLSSLFFFLISLGDRDYTILGEWWPVFLFVAGISFLALWLAQQLQDWGVLFLALVGMIGGSVALAINLQALGPNTVHELNNLSPALLILVGLVLLLRNALSKRSASEDQS
ncbi:MAG: hypothetical protein PVI59_06670 [Anaerolineae bacterium]|jgi:hypothetical protein